MQPAIRIGSRGSRLALAQAGWVRDRILGRFPGISAEIVILSTSADRNPAESIRSGSAIGVFVKELEQALLAGSIDLAVHSMKDLPTLIPAGLAIAAVPEREDARDALIRAARTSLARIPPGARVATGSVRRQAQLLALRPDLTVVDMRGNVDTRLRKLQEGSCDALILACAGLRRLGLMDARAFPLEFAEMLPAPGQGALAIEARSGDQRARTVAAALDHAPARIAVTAERAFLERMGGGCNVPVAALARIEGDLLSLEGLVASPDGRKFRRDQVQSLPAEAEQAARALAERILDRGGREILDES